MIATIFAVAWYVALAVLMVGAAVFGRPHGQVGSRDQDESYELGRWSERNDHARRVREEELAELRRHAPRSARPAH